MLLSNRDPIGHSRQGAAVSCALYGACDSPVTQTLRHPLTAHAWLLTIQDLPPTRHTCHLTVTKPYIGGCVSLPRKWPLMPQITRYVPGCRKRTTSTRSWRKAVPLR